MRKRKPKMRVITPDPIYKDTMVTQFVNNMMLDGKKSTAFKVFYDAMAIVKERTDQPEHEIWKKGLNNVIPQVEVRSRRIGGATFQIPSEIRAGRKTSIGMKNLIGFSCKRHEKSMGQKLAGEILAAYKEEGSAFKKKEDTHRMAEANKAFSHFRF